MLRVVVLVFAVCCALLDVCCSLSGLGCLLCVDVVCCLRFVCLLVVGCHMLCAGCWLSFVVSGSLCVVRCACLSFVDVASCLLVFVCGLLLFVVVG